MLKLDHGENTLHFNEIMMISPWNKSNTIEWKFIVLTHWNNIPGVVVLLHSNILSFFPFNKFLSLTQLCCVLSQEARNISFIVFGLTLPQPNLEPKICLRK